MSGTNIHGTMYMVWIHKSFVGELLDVHWTYFGYPCVIAGPEFSQYCKLIYSPVKGINDAINQKQGYNTSEGDQPSFLVEGKVIAGQAYLIM